ncbi:MAG: hypothetical protein AAGA48_04490 [Myxococcota bacterium]
MSTDLTFFPWIRRGFARFIDTMDDGTYEISRDQSLTAYIEIDGNKANTTFSVRPPDQVRSIDTSQVLRRYPSPNTPDAESGYFPHIEFVAPDLPWAVTPLAPSDAGRLRPWLALVCVEEANLTFAPGAGEQPAQLTTTNAELPPSNETYGWAHVQSSIDNSTSFSIQRTATIDAVDNTPGTVRSRLICPRRLKPNTAYRAAVVHTLSADGDTLKPAWGPGSDFEGETTSVTLRVLDSWTFRTGEAGSFEELVGRLGPADESVTIGVRPVDMSEPGSIPVSWNPPVFVDYAGAMMDNGTVPTDLQGNAGQFEGPVRDLLNQGSSILIDEPDSDDPVVTIPFYGAYAADNHQVPASGWQRELNLSPANRMAAGLGADVVRTHQERFMAEAWTQAGAIREANRELSLSRLRAEVSRTTKQRGRLMTSYDLGTVFRSQLAYTRVGPGQSPTQYVQSSTAPTAMMSPAFMRTVRPGGVMETTARKRFPNAGFSALREGFQLFETEQWLEPPDFPPAPAAPIGTVRSAGRLAGANYPDAPDITPAPTAPEPFSPELVRTAFESQVWPMRTARVRITTRIPALATFIPPALAVPNQDAELPTRIRLGPRIDEALMWLLSERSYDLLIPGVTEFPTNAVRALRANPTFVASFLAGANHEMTRELLWREFPATPGSTTFRRFWDRPDTSSHDITDLSTWASAEQLEDLGAGGGEALVILIRGDVVRQYPSVRFMVGKTGEAEFKLPVFGGNLGEDLRFLAFDEVDPTVALDPGSGWQLMIEEPPTEPRFGLDLQDPDDLLAWSDLTWGHLDDQGDFIMIGESFPSSFNAPEGDGVAPWGGNGANMAQITFQNPVRRLMNLSQLAGTSN